ncbi:MAG TPA: CHASE2 domain-containing protein [Methylomirabilota bacterium]|nr:CHASE2 domain-containing protein [Methylomirabilota bacterium]
MAGFAAFGLGYTPLAESWERRTLDIRSRLFADERHADKSIVAVVIDQRSVDLIAAQPSAGGLDTGWPWPRDYYAKVASYLLQSGARAVAFDMIFSERSIYSRLGVADDDRELAKAIAGKPVVQAVMLSDEVTAGPTAKADRAWPDGLLTDRGTRRLTRAPLELNNKATLPVPPLIGAAAGLGWIGFRPDEDGICRSMLPAAGYAPVNSRDAVEIWSLPFAMASLLGHRLESRPGLPAAVHLTLDGRRVPLDEDGRFLLRYHGGEGTYRQFPFLKVLQAALLIEAGRTPFDAAPEEFRDKIVIIGATASGLLDSRPTSVAGVTPGYVIHATALDNLLNGDGLVRPALLPRTVALIVFAMLCGALFGAIPTLRGSSIAALAVIIGYIGVALWLFSSHQVWLLTVTPVVAIAAAFLGDTGYGYLTEGRERRFLRDAFGRYVAPEVVAQLVRNPGQFALGGETREMTVMFVDVAGFTTLSEGRPPAQLVQLMNECFTEIAKVIQGHGGTVDKFIGDAVMAFWNAPVEYPDHAARACRAAQDILKVLMPLNVGWAQRGLPAISMRVGAATGPALVGNVGSSTKFNYTVMGDTVNLASRLEGAAKVFGTLNLVAGSTVQAAAGAVACRELDWLAVKGKSEAVPVFEIMPGEATPSRVEAWERYAAGLAAYRARKFDEALEQFHAALKAEPEDGPSKEMIARCEEYLVTPPPDDWRGEHALHSK